MAGFDPVDSLWIHEQRRRQHERSESTHANIGIARRGGGQQLPSGIRGDMEMRLGADLGQVRLHNNVPSQRVNQDLDARAVTVGQDVLFGSHRFSPNTHVGRHLLAHELAHTVQAGADSRVVQRAPASTGKTGEKKQQEVAHRDQTTRIADCIYERCG